MYFTEAYLLNPYVYGIRKKCMGIIIKNMSQDSIINYIGDIIMNYTCQLEEDLDLQFLKFEGVFR